MKSYKAILLLIMLLVKTLAQAGTTEVSVNMGNYHFAWTLDKQNIKHGVFVDGQPWIVIPSGGVNLISATPSRTIKNVYFPGTTPAKPVPATNTIINITVVNPPPGSYCFKKNGNVYYGYTNAFGWDSRAMTDTRKPRSTWQYGWNPNLGWDGKTPLPLHAGDSITTPQSATSMVMKCRFSSLEAVAVLTVLDTPPPKNAFRPGCIRSKAKRKNYHFVTLSDIRTDLDKYLIADPLAQGIVSLDGQKQYLDLKQSRYSYKYLKQLLPGPGIRNFGREPSEGASPWYNDSEQINSWGKPASVSAYGGSMGLRFGALSIGSLASWLTPEQRLQCQKLLIQRAIDIYDAFDAGLVRQEDCGIQPGISAMITVAGAMLKDNCPRKSELLAVNDEINGFKPWVYCADYAMMKHTFTKINKQMVNGEKLSDRGVPIGMEIGDMAARPQYNMTNITGIISATTNSLTMSPEYKWPHNSVRPFYDLINVKLRITGGPGAGKTIYVITQAPQKSFHPGWNHGGTLIIKPAWKNGLPTEKSILAFSATTSQDVNKWIFCSRGRSRYQDSIGEQAIMAREEVTLAPNNGAYLGIHLGATLDQLIAIYALDAEKYYRSGLAHWAIESGKLPGCAESIFNTPAYLAGYGAHRFRGALWRQEVLNKVGAPFIYTDGKTDNLSLPPPDAKLWYEIK